MLRRAHDKKVRQIIEEWLRAFAGQFAVSLFEPRPFAASKATSS
jgi:hypothetical protein